MKTRKMYLNNECTYREYNAQFVTKYIINLVKSNIGLDRILNSKDEHLNDIRLSEWDRLANCINPDFKSCGDFTSLAGKVCVLKEAAKQIKEQYNNK